MQIALQFATTTYKVEEVEESEEGATLEETDNTRTMITIKKYDLKTHLRPV